VDNPRRRDRRQPKLATDAIAGVREGGTVPPVPRFGLPHDLNVPLVDAFVEHHVARQSPPAPRITVFSGRNVPH
jgi:hypothetical protein